MEEEITFKDFLKQAKQGFKDILDYLPFKSWFFFSLIISKKSRDYISPTLISKEHKDLTKPSLINTN